MRSYSLKWNKRLKDLTLPYAECRKVYINDKDKINKLLKENISNDDYHLYTYNDKVKFLIKEIKVKNNKIVLIVAYLLSNNIEEIDNLYFEIRDEVLFDIDSLSYMHNYKNAKSIKYIFWDDIGIIKNFEKCLDNENIMISDMNKANEITKLELKDGYYYLGNNKYASKTDYKKYVDKYCNEICCGLIDKELYVVLRHIGPYNTIYKTYNKLLKLIKKENKKIVGLPMEQFISGRWNEKNENKYITNIMIPIEENKIS